MNNYRTMKFKFNLVCNFVKFRLEIYMYLYKLFYIYWIKFNLNFLLHSFLNFINIIIFFIINFLFNYDFLNFEIFKAINFLLTKNHSLMYLKFRDIQHLQIHLHIYNFLGRVLIKIKMLLENRSIIISFLIVIILIIMTIFMINFTYNTSF